MALDESKRFVYFAFRQLRRIPAEWQDHYRYELKNTVSQKQFKGHPDPAISSRPEYYRLNAIRKGYHGVKWVLSRFELDCPPIPEMFADPDAEIYTNEEDSGVYGRVRRDRLFNRADEFDKVRTMSEAETMIVKGKAFEIGDPSDSGLGKGELLNPFADAMPHRLSEPSEMTREDLEEDEEDARFGGTLYGSTKGYPEGMDAETAERSPVLAVWHSNKATEIERGDIEAYARSVPARGDAELHRKALSQLDDGRTEGPASPGGSRWVRGEDGKWKRNSSVAAPKVPDIMHPPWLTGDY